MQKTNKQVLFLITARSGSKSVPHKNIKLLSGIPLIGYRIQSTLKITAAENIWVSTDSQEYADIAIQSGACVPFIRPAALATDSASSADVVLHAMAFAEKKGLIFDYIALIEPTSPFVYPADLSQAIDQLDQEKEVYEAIVAVREVRPHSVFVVDDSKDLAELSVRLDKLSGLGRQCLKKQITPSGGFYISGWEAFKKNKSFYTKKTLAYELPEESELEIDEPIDWNWAEFLIEKRIVDTEKILQA